MNILKFFKLLLTLFRDLPAPPQPVPTPPPLPVEPLPPPITPSERLYDVACTWLGKDASPGNVAPFDLACAETVDSLHFFAFGLYINGTKNKVTVSTFDLYKLLKKSVLFVEVPFPGLGDIVIFPSGLGDGRIEHGHTGIMGKKDLVMSNNSKDGKLDTHLTLTWMLDYYTRQGSIPGFYFKRV